ncbi:MAG: PEGA domain-containing protein [Methanoregula sp.]|jgi:hypothetical protein
MIKHLWVISVVFILILLFGISPGAASVQTYRGDTVKLSGYCYTSSTVYLFLTGPNLPVNGVALDNIYRRADQGGFTQVDVANDHWEYEWDTGAVGSLDPGTYTVWVANGPNDRSNLGEAEYSTISVSLGTPGISATIGSSVTPAVPGSMNILSLPDNASVTVNGKYQGSTPLTVTSLDPGAYTVNISRFDYEMLSTKAVVKSAEITEVSAKLVPKTGTLVINTTPTGANITLDGTPAGSSPVTLNSISAGNHTVNATLEGYLPVQEPVKVIADQTTTSEIELYKPDVLPGISSPVPVAIIVAALGFMAVIFGGRRSRK